MDLYCVKNLIKPKVENISMTRLQKLTEKLLELKLDSLLVFNQYNITYLTGFTGHAATLLVTNKTSYLITDYRYYQDAKAQTTGLNVICRDRVNQSLAECIKLLILKDELKQLAFESEHISQSQWQIISEPLSDITVTGQVRLVENLRYFKDESEIANIQSAASIADKALNNCIKLAKPGVSERDLAIELEYQMRKLGSEEMSFATILLFGARSALPHGVPGNQTLKHGDLILVDFGAVVNGYRSDMTRTYVCGKPDSQQLEVYEVVRKAQQAAIDAVTSGVTGEYLNQVSEAVLNTSRFSEYKGEGLGHGVGLELHEFPFMGKGCKLKVEQGCVITIEPGIYIPGWGGVRIEDDVVLTSEGLVILNNAPKNLLEL